MKNITGIIMVALMCLAQNLDAKLNVTSNVAGGTIIEADGDWLSVINIPSSILQVDVHKGSKVVWHDVDPDFNFNNYNVSNKPGGMYHVLVRTDSGFDEAWLQL